MLKRVIKYLCLWLGSFISIIVILALILIINGNCYHKFNKDYDKSLTTWMANIDDNKLINEVIIPGSHDAGSAGMNYLGETQHLTIKEQLLVGTRYFDIRVRNKDNEYIIYHSIINGNKYLPMLLDIKEFINTNTSEFLILDYQHFDNSEDYIHSTLLEHLKDKLVINDTNMSDLEFISKLKVKDVRGKVIVFFGGNTKYHDNNYIFNRNNDSGAKLDMSLDSYYDSDLHKSSSKEFISKFHKSYLDKINNKINNEGFKGLFVLQCQLTDGKMIFGPYSRERSHNKNITNYISDLPNKDGFKHINIIMRDFIDDVKTKQIIELNGEV